MSANEYKGHQIAPVESAPCQTRSTYAVVKAPPPKMSTFLRFHPVVISPNDAAYFLTLVIYVVLCGECAEGYSLG